MVGILAGHIVNVQRHQRVIDEALEELMEQIYIKITYVGAHKFHIKD